MLLLAVTERRVDLRRSRGGISVSDFRKSPVFPISDFTLLMSAFPALHFTDPVVLSGCHRCCRPNSTPQTSLAAQAKPRQRCRPHLPLPTTLGCRYHMKLLLSLSCDALYKQSRPRNITILSNTLSVPSREEGSSDAGKRC